MRFHIIIRLYSKSRNN